MADEKAAGSTASDNVSLEDFAAAAFADYAEPSGNSGSGDESPVGSAEAKGLTPDAESADTPETPAPLPDGTDAEHAEVTSAVAATAETDDPLTGATPLDYVADGEAKTYQGITLLKNGGAIVEAEHVPQLRQTLGKADHYYRESQGLNARLQQVESLLKWDYRDQQGNPRSLTGLDAIELRESARAVATAERNILLPLLENPDRLINLLTVSQDPQTGAYTYGLNKPMVDAVRAELKNAADGARLQVRSAFVNMPRGQAVQPSAETTAPDFGATVDTAAQSLGLSLSPESKTFLASQAPRYVRETTAEERPNYGPRILDTTFLDLVKREGARVTDAAKIATAATAASRTAAAAIAASKVGKPQAKPTARPAAPQREGDDPVAAAWAARERAAARAI